MRGHGLEELDPVALGMGIDLGLKTSECFNPRSFVLVTKQHRVNLVPQR